MTGTNKRGGIILLKSSAITAAFYWLLGEPYVAILEMARTEQAIERGLSGRESVSELGGMLFVFDDHEPPDCFWMKDCLCDIDVLFVAADGTVTACHEMKMDPRAPGETEDEYEVRLRAYLPNGTARFAVELAAGTIKRLGVRAGDVLDIVDHNQETTT